MIDCNGGDGSFHRILYYCLGKMIYQSLEDAIKGAREFADAFDMDGCVKITETPDGGYELFGTGNLVKLV